LTLGPRCDGGLQCLPTLADIEQNVCAFHIGGWPGVARHGIIIHLVPLAVGCFDVSVIVPRIRSTSSMRDDTVQRVRGTILALTDCTRQGEAFVVPNWVSNFAPKR
jgi:hypothetical protein